MNGIDVKGYITAFDFVHFVCPLMRAYVGWLCPLADDVCKYSTTNQQNRGDETKFIGNEDE